MSSGRVQRAHRVTAIFHDAELSFDLARDATLAKLAEQLSMLGRAPRRTTVGGQCEPSRRNGIEPLKSVTIRKR